MTLRYRTLPHIRRRKLKMLLASKSGIRIIEAHDGLSALIGTTVNLEESDGTLQEFDGLWVSSLTDSAAKGHPDTEVIDTSSRLQTIQEILQVTNKPIIVDGDTGGQPTEFEYFCSKLESLGVSAVVIEDKKYPKRNSLAADAVHILEDPHEFAAKINRAKAVCLSDDFMIFTRIESFIAKRGLTDAISRAEIYLDSDADGIFIHSNAKTPEQIYEFMSAYEKLCARKGIIKPVISVPTTYNQATEQELFQHGFNIVIYANHLLRAAHRAMSDTCQSILRHRRSTECVPNIAPVKQIMELVGFTDVKEKDNTYKRHTTPVIILASGKPKGFTDTEFAKTPVSNIPIGNHSLLSWQRKTLSACGLDNISLVSGYKKEQLDTNGLNEIHNKDYADTNVLFSLMLASKQMQQGFIMIFGDIFFDENLITRYVLNAKNDILLLVDNSFNLHTRKRIKPTTDLVTLQQSDTLTLRKPNSITEQVADIGNDIPLENASHEFIGIAKFSATGAKLLNQTVCAMQQKVMPQAGNANALRQLNFYAVIKQLIADKHQVESIEVNQGWSEVHNMTDIAAIEKAINKSKKGKKTRLLKP